MSKRSINQCRKELLCRNGSLWCPQNCDCKQLLDWHLVPDIWGIIINLYFHLVYRDAWNLGRIVMLTFKKTKTKRIYENDGSITHHAVTSEQDIIYYCCNPIKDILPLRKHTLLKLKPYLSSPYKPPASHMWYRDTWYKYIHDKTTFWEVRSTVECVFSMTAHVTGNLALHVPCEHYSYTRFGFDEGLIL